MQKIHAVVAPFNDGTDKVSKHQKHLNERFFKVLRTLLYVVCQSTFFKQFLQNFTKFIRKLRKMDGLYFKSLIVFGPGTFRLYLVYVRNRKKAKILYGRSKHKPTFTSTHD